VADGQAGGAAGEAAVGDQRAGLAQAPALEERGRVEHLLHAGAALGALVADDDDVALLDPLVQDPVDGFFLRFADHGRAFEGPDRLVDARGLHDAAVLGEVAVENGQAAVGGVGVCDVADAAAFGVGVQGVPALGLGEGGRGADAAGGGVEELDGLGGGRTAADVPLLQPVGERIGCARSARPRSAGRARYSSPRMAGMPPARWTSSM
jgi:hypothetical protein